MEAKAQITLHGSQLPVTAAAYLVPLLNEHCLHHPAITADALVVLLLLQVPSAAACLPDAPLPDLCLNSHAVQFKANR